MTEVANELERLMLEQVPAVLWATDATLRFTASIGAGLRHLGLQPGQVVGQSLYQFFATDDPGYPPIAAHTRALGGEAQEFEATWFGRNYTCHVEPLRGSTGAIEGTLGLATDMTERRRLEEALTQAQKMEAVGRLAGGIAHDFNNLLTVINGSAERLTRIAAPETASVEVQDILRAGERAATLTRQLLAFSRKQRLDPKLTELDRLIDESCALMRPLLGERVQLTFAGGATPTLVNVDAGQITQVLMNLVLNARDAMPSGGKVRIETSVVAVPGNDRRAPPRARPGTYVRLIVSDSGPGIEPDVLPHIFDPFFTTKQAGTGLGLATVYGVVEQSGGYVSVDSTPGQGASFRIYLPRAEGSPSPAEAPRAAPRGGSETILLVEDEAVVRGLVQRTLRAEGYRVHAVASAEEALELIDGGDIAPALVLTDVVLAGMTGPVLVQRLRQVRPGLKALLMSGYSHDALSGDAPREPLPLLEKPFTLEALVRIVREILDR